MATARMMYEGFDLTLPKFLRRKRNKEHMAIVEHMLAQTTRSWAPIRKRSEWARPAVLPVASERPELPVKVQVKGKAAGSTLLATYANMAEFEAKHNRATYPLKGQPVVFENHTVVLVTAKPWAGKKDDATKREGPKRSAVKVNGKEYGSVWEAFQAFGLSAAHCRKFRAELKQKRKLALEHNGTKYKFETVI